MEVELERLEALLGVRLVIEIKVLGAVILEILVHSCEEVLDYSLLLRALFGEKAKVSEALEDGVLKALGSDEGLSWEIGAVHTPFGPLLGTNVVLLYAVFACRVKLIRFGCAIYWLPTGASFGAALARGAI